MAAASPIQVSGLAKAELAALRKQAQARGLSPQRYARLLIEHGLALDRRAKHTGFDELFAPVQARFRNSRMSEAELDGLVDAARTRHRRRSAGKKKN